MPHDAQGRPLALPHGYPGIRYSVALRGAAEEDQQRWISQITRSIQICELFQKVLDVVSPIKKTRSVRFLLMSNYLHSTHVVSSIFNLF